MADPSSAHDDGAEGAANPPRRVRDPETTLMLQVAEGDDRAFSALVVRMLPRLEGFFRRLGADPSQAEDCAQDVLLKVYRARRNYQARARFTTYLFHVARNHWIDLYRHRKNAPPTFSADQAGGEGGSSLSAELEAGSENRDADDRLIHDALRAAVAALPEDHREVFVLTRVEGLRYQEISEILDIPVGTVKSRMHAAVRHLRRFLAARGLEP